jgi:hypothetical protein
VFVGWRWKRAKIIDCPWVFVLVGWRWKRAKIIVSYLLIR